MSRLLFISIDGKQYRWKDILEIRRSQVAAYAAPATQLALFEALHDDTRPAEARTSTGRYQQPSLFEIGA
jgi:hypothetical protein